MACHNIKNTINRQEHFIVNPTVFSTPESLKTMNNSLTRCNYNLVKVVIKSYKLKSYKLLF